jgi:uncharacterized membrane protein SirB2
MENGHPLRTGLLVVAGLVVVGAVSVWLIGQLLGLIWYLVVGALVVGGVVYVGRRARRALGGGRQRRIGPR